MFQNLDTWLVLLSLAVTIVALGAWIKDAGDDWLCRNDSGDSLPRDDARSSSSTAMAGRRQAGA